MKKVLKEEKWFIYTLLILISATVILMLPSWWKGDYFVGGGDIKTQWFPFYVLNKRETLSAIKDRVFPFYTWSLFLGSNLWASKATYGLFDIFNIITYPITANYYFVYDLQIFLKVIVSGVTSYLLFYQIYRNKKVSGILGICYGLSSYAIYFTSQTGFLSFYSLLPLYFLGIEQFLTRKGKTLFICSVFVLLMTNYYLFFGISVMTPAYYLYRYNSHVAQFKNIFCSIVEIILYYLIGVLLSCAVIAPSFFYIIGNDRIGNYNNNPLYASFTVYTHLLVSAFSPSHVYIYGENVYNISAHFLKEICLYAGSITALLVPQAFFDKDIRIRVSSVLLYAYLLVFSFIPILSSLLNGFSNPCFRWFCFFILINLLVSGRYLSDISLINKKVLKVTVFVDALVLFGSYLLTVHVENLLLSKYLNQLILFVVVVCFMALQVYFLIKKNRISFVLLAFELMLYCFLCGVRNTVTSQNKDKVERLSARLANMGDYTQLPEFLNNLKDENYHELFRVYVPYETVYWIYSHDLSALFNISDSLTYDSMYTPSFDRMKEIAGDQITETLPWEFNIKNNDILNFLSFKYAIVCSEEEIPFTNYEIIVTDYRYDLWVVENLDYRPFGGTVTDLISYSEAIYANDLSLLSKKAICDDNISQYIGDEEVYFEEMYYNHNHISAIINNKRDGFVVMSLPYLKGWKIYINGEITNYYECNGGMTGFPVNEGFNQIEMYFVPQGFKAGAIMSTVGFVLLAAVNYKSISNTLKRSLK